jgi:hypothetical protein
MQHLNYLLACYFLFQSSNEGFRVDSSLVVCRYQLDSTPCQIVPCPFQHLHQKDVRQLEK